MFSAIEQIESGLRNIDVVKKSSGIISGKYYNVSITTILLLPVI